MANQIAALANTRIDNNNDRREQPEDEEHQFDPTHISETIRVKDARPPRNEEAWPSQNEHGKPENEDTEPDNAVGLFTAKVMNFKLPRIFTLPPTLTAFNGLGDPKKYLKIFKFIMIVNGVFDSILCRYFSSYLDGHTLDWFCSLPADSISHFRQLVKLFEDHFVGSAIYLHNSDYLNTIKQGQNESLKDYMTLFTKIAMSIPDLHPEVLLHAIKSGLRPEKFQETIAVAKLNTLAEFREKAKGQMDIEELQQGRKGTNLSTKMKRDDIIKEILNSKMIKPPQKADTYQEVKNVDKSKYCTFHQKHGHTTDECVIAKDLLEKLTKD
ncbi:uncharacterized protein LOC107647359 [Arachis ipaensis]|uniref:uncharacterized protein LOC107647359 n=1 Tax=Arachis ipaensis TaxID=130454 RepID=UPI0007AFC07D|nr:uncharacterized protein LOC107647359 [Arachis ipaensis]